MKKSVLLLLIFIPALILTFSCKEKKSEQETFPQPELAKQTEKTEIQKTPRLAAARIGEVNFDEAKINPSEFISDKFKNDIIHDFSKLYLIGFSADGKIAFIESRQLEGVGAEQVIFFVQDLVSDDILEKIDGQGEEGAEGAFMHFLKKNGSAIDSALEKHGIKKSPCKYEEFPYNEKDREITVSVSVSDTGKLQYDFLRIIDYSCIASNEAGKKKVLRAKKDAVLENAFVCGFIKNPFENRLAVVIAEEKYGFEGFDILYSFSGCDIYKGF